ncbi:MAG: hypothetical protein JNL98_18125 [Bryobacterales bacterium]|nr:hypothetical protein [Bryobacterales bacterium]
MADRRVRIQALDAQHITTGNIRLLLGIAAAAIAWQAFSAHRISPWWLAAPVVGFAVLMIRHERILRKRTLAQRAAQFYERGIARLEHRWAGTGECGLRFASAAHPYSGDLDLFGKGSLFELLNQARTSGGEDWLAGCLLAPSSSDQIMARQRAVEELRPAIDLREEIFVLGEDVREAVDSKRLVEWGESPALLDTAKLQWMAGALSLLVAVSFFVMLKTGLVSVFALMLVAVAGFGYWLRPRVLAVITRVDEAVHDLELLSELLVRIESREFESPRLSALKQALSSNGVPPSRHIRRLHRLAELLDSRDNIVMRVLGPPLLYATHLAFAVERWRAANGSDIRRWLDTLSEFEAISSFAGYTYEHPGDPFPVFDHQTVIDGEDLGHPLLPEGRCVRNSVKLDAERRMLVVSGSNMSGKSTYLRTIGVNVVLAMAGLPVRAKSLRLCPLAVGAAIRVTDSLQEGASRFYAEIVRLRKILDLTGGGTRVLFLLDELLAGTNSHDRRIGAEGILKELLAREAVGLITTHDLALTAIAETLGSSAVNVHFEDHLENGQLRFDYTLRPGVVRKSNALELMRSIGLDV